LFAESMSLTTFHHWVSCLDLGDFLSPEIPVSCQKSQFSSGLYSLVRPTKL
jgi:hypothetical protein